MFSREPEERFFKIAETCEDGSVSSDNFVPRLFLDISIFVALRKLTRTIFV